MTHHEKQNFYVPMNKANYNRNKATMELNLVHGSCGAKVYLVDMDPSHSKKEMAKEALGDGQYNDVAIWVNMYN